MTKHKRLFRDQFDVDPLFGYKFMHALDQHFQRFLSECMDAISIADVDPSFFDMSYIVSSVVHLRFQCTLPPLFSDSTASCVTPKSHAKGTKKNDGKTDKDDQSRVAVNDLACPEWNFPEDTNLCDDFLPQAFKECPKFNNSCQC